MNAATRGVLALGHSNHSFHSFAVSPQLPQQYEVTAVADVRSTP